MEGFAEGVGLAARNAAIENAKQEIIRKLLNAVVASGDLSHLQNVLRNASQYVRGYDKIRHDIAGDTTRVEIDAYIDARPLYQDVAATMLPYLPEPPRVLLVIGEQIGNDKIIAVPDFGYAETALRQGLEKLRLTVAGVDTLGREYKQEALIQTVTGDLETGATFAKGNSADVVILGTATTEQEAPVPGTNVVKNKASVTVRVYRALDGDLVDAFTKTAAVSSAAVTEGAIQATNDACEKLVGEVAIAAVLTVLGTAAEDTVLLLLEHPETPERVEQVTAALAQDLGPDHVAVLFQSTDTARLRIRYDGPMLPFVDKLSTADYGGKTLNVRRAVGREVTATFE
ncbi:MAG: hypothetical protein HYV26_01545, partial [Candidatus Hydrogenedentes bacterium]|nr:hypothetical protein [Candidatus Hydrogenedentota bacterium]